MFSCDYNGWSDVPEEEREGIDAFEATGSPNPNPGNISNAESTMRLLPAHSREAAMPRLMIHQRRAA